MNLLGFHVHSWKSWTTSQNVGKAGEIPSLLRRRVTPIGQQALSAAWGLTETQATRLILSSRHGEFSRTLALLEAVTNQNDISPADFTLSVHHALIGLLSIAQHNPKGHIAVASGSESFCFGLLEAVSYLHENPSEQVVLVHFDDLLPGSFASFNEQNESPIALALAIASTGDGAEIQIDVEASRPDEKKSDSHAQDFMDFLASDTMEVLSIGERQRWRWMRHAMV